MFTGYYSKLAKERGFVSYSLVSSTLVREFPWQPQLCVFKELIEVEEIYCNTRVVGK